VKPRVLRCRHCLLRITSAPENVGARPSAPSAWSAQEIVPCAPTALPVARRWTVDGRSGWSYRDRVRGNHLKSNGGALADGADANIGRRSGQRKITTPPGPGGHKRGRAPHLLPHKRGRLRNDPSWANTPASHARCDLAHMPRRVSRSRIAADEDALADLARAMRAGATPITAGPLRLPLRPAQTPLHGPTPGHSVLVSY
jgi:hypothetical protein